jgi:hypothetical protein
LNKKTDIQSLYSIKDYIRIIEIIFDFISVRLILLHLVKKRKTGYGKSDFYLFVSGSIIDGIIKISSNLIREKGIS